MSATAAGTSRPISRRPRPLVLMLLALSVALNLFFVGGALWIRLHPAATLSFQEQRFRRMANELDLAPSQRDAFNRYVEAMRARTARMHQELAPLFGGAWEEMAKPQADEAQVMRLFDEASEKRRGFQREATTQTLAFLATLSPAQRTKFLAIVQAHWAPWHQKHTAKP